MLYVCLCVLLVVIFRFYLAKFNLIQRKAMLFLMCSEFIFVQMKRPLVKENVWICFVGEEISHSLKET